MGKFLWWLVAAFLTMMGLGSLADSTVGGLVILFAALLSVPPVWNAIQSKVQFGFHKSIVAVLTVAGIGIAMQSPANQARIAANEKKDAAKAKTVDAAATDSKPASKYADTGKQYAWIEVGKDAIKAKLRDPDSAKFRDVRFYSGGGVPVACGEVNAKNGFGGYSGFEHFIAAGSDFAFLESEVSDGIDKVWNKFCVAGPDDEANSN